MQRPCAETNSHDGRREFEILAPLRESRSEKGNNMNISSATGNFLLNSLNDTSSKTAKSNRNSQMNAIFKASIAANRERIYDLINSKFNVSDSLDTQTYKDVAEDAAKLQKCIKTLSSDETGNIYENALENQDMTKIVSQIKGFVEDYNTLWSDINKVGGTIKNVYGSEIYDVISSNKDTFANVGIFVSEDGKISLDLEKLNDLKAEDVKNTFVSENSVLSDISKNLTEVIDVINQAIRIKEAMSTSYTNSGNYKNSLLSTYYEAQG